MIDPTLTRSVARGRFAHERTVSDSTISPYPAVDQTDEYSGEVMMSPAELRVIGRLSARVNVLPVIAKADSLTDDSLLAVKTAVRKGLRQAGLSFGVFSSGKPREELLSQTSSQEEVTNDLHNGVNGRHFVENGVTDGERVARTVVTRRGARTSRSRSRSRRDLSSIALDEREPQYPDEMEEETVANIRFSAQTVTRVNLDSLLPFALIAPEPVRSPWPKRPTTSDSDHSLGHENTNGTVDLGETARTHSPIVSRKSTASIIPQESLRGVFTRKFRWGTVDVLNPDHCDFAALRTAILLTHMKVRLQRFTWLRAVSADMLDWAGSQGSYSGSSV